MSKGQNCSFKFAVNTDKPMQKKDMIFQQTQRRAQYGQKISLKNSFVCSLWSWARLYIGKERMSLIGFLEWLASN